VAQRITTAEAQAWVEATKFTVPDVTVSPNSELLTEIEEEVIARVSSAYNTTTWVDATTTPRLVRVAIAKKFVAWAYRRAYSESLEGADATYASLLDANAETIIQGIVDGSIDIPGIAAVIGKPVFYPTDASSALTPTVDDPSLGPSKFSMGQVF
jgi:hypothetical protein